MTTNDPTYRATGGNRFNGGARWLKSNLLQLITIAFLAGNAAAFVRTSDRIDDSIVDSIRADSAIVALVNELNEDLEGHIQVDERRHCLLAYAIDFPDSQCEWFFDWLDGHPEVLDRIRGRYNGRTNGDTLR